MATNIKSGMHVGSGALVDSTTSVAVGDTRIRAIYATGVGTFAVVGTSTTALGTINGSIIRFAISTISDSAHLVFPDIGMRMAGTITVSAPTSASTITVFYG